MNRFTKEALKVPDLDQKVAMIALQQGTTDDNFRRSLAKRAPDNMNELQERAGKYIKAEESMRKSQNNQGPTTDSKKRGNDTEYDADNKYLKREDGEKSPTKKQSGPRFTEYARLNAPRSQILMEIEKEGGVRWPKPIRTDPEKRNKDLYCRFHKDTGHKTDDCRQLKDEIEFLIRKGKLSRYTRDADRNPRDNDSRDRDNDDHDRRTEPRGPVINMISGGPTAAGLSSNSRKAYAREVMCIVGEPPKRAKTEIALTFDDSDLEGVKFPHDDPLVITPVIGNSSIKRVLVDNGASVDILFYDAYQKMGYADSQLTPSNMPIYGFNGVESKIEGMIQLPVTMGAEPRQATYMLNFMVIKASSTYNAILGRTGMHAFKAIASTYHLKIKFPTRNGVGEEKGDQKMARSCYVAALKPGGVGGQVLSIKELVPISLYRGKPEKVMAFDLKNARATYWHLANKMFKHLNEKTVEVYVNDMLVKSLKKADHLERLREAFRVLRTNKIEVLTDQPLRMIMHSPKASGRLIKWAVELENFDIRYKPRVAIKAQALADFLVKCTIDNQEVGGQESRVEEPKEEEKLNELFDEVSKTNGAGLVLQTPDGFVIEFSTKQDFPATNNEAECEALLACLGLARTLRIKNLKVWGDSRLEVFQLAYGAKAVVSLVATRTTFRPWMEPRFHEVGTPPT